MRSYYLVLEYTYVRSLVRSTYIILLKFTFSPVSSYNLLQEYTWDTSVGGKITPPPKL